MAVKQLGPAASGPSDAVRKSELDAVSGGGGVPGGSTTQIQFNNAGAFGGDADLTWDSVGNTLGLNGVDTGIDMKGITAEPGAIAADTLHVYAKKIAGRMSPKVKGPSGVDTPLQNALWGNNVVMWTPTGATSGLWVGTTGISGGTYSTGSPTTTTLYTTTRRGRWANVVTTANQTLGPRMSETMFFRGSTVGGGFFFFARFGFDVWTNGGRMFAGLNANTSPIATDVGDDQNAVGFLADVADNGLISFYSRGAGSASKVSTGFTITSNKGYDVYLFCKPGGAEIGWRIVDINTGTEASGTETSVNIPVSTTMMGAMVQASNAALTPVTSIQLGVNRIYVETDY